MHKDIQKAINEFEEKTLFTGENYIEEYPPVQWLEIDQELEKVFKLADDIHFFKTQAI